MIALARRVTEVTGNPVVGGVAVVLHGGGRHTYDIDIYSEDFWVTHRKLEDAGILWDHQARQHMFQGIAVHMVDAESLGGPPRRISTIKGVKVIGLADLVRAKLTVGLQEVGRQKDVVHVLDLIDRVPLKKDFAAKLPAPLRRPFKVLVDQVHEPRRTSVPPAVFYAEFGGLKRRVV
ncbi:MAG: hypothetical protein GIKADHBN_01176 [Phycisphaerales bacterium]|nr:hypothetical protein [Phycisphaerales bacterium]